MPPARVWISEIEFNNGRKMNFDKNDIIVFVGPNNQGKSATLKELAAHLRAKNQRSIIAKDITIQKEGDDNDLSSFIDTNSMKFFREDTEPYFRGMGYDFQMTNAKRLWSRCEYGLNDLYSLFVNALTTESRLSLSNPPSSIDIFNDPPNNPIHILLKIEERERTFCTYFRQAFGLDLIVYRGPGNAVPLYVGEKPVPEEGEERISNSYLEKVHKLPLLQFQGDGMRSFVGVLLSAFISKQSILFIDEPEAFLHPPQARLMGQMLARDLPSGRQLFLATHSEDFLKGLLDTNSDNLNIIRIKRDGDINIVRDLSSDAIKSIWSDPLLRHSNILNGLFHSKVIICEGDSDCRFYLAILSAIHEDTGSISPDVLFVHCGGKHRIPSVIKALKGLDVDVRVITDFDILNSVDPLNQIYEGLGGTWNNIAMDSMIVRKSIDEQRPELEVNDLRGEINTILDSCDRLVPREKISEIKKALNKASTWSKAKEIGKEFIPRGDPFRSYQKVHEELIGKGLHVVEVGQVESFYKTIGNHGPKWVNDVLQKDLKNDTDLEAARIFVKSVIE